MRPKQPEAPSDDLFRSSLEAILDPRHELIGLSALIDWGRFDAAFGTHYHDRKGRRGLPTRLMTGLHLLKHMKGLSDEETCAAWLENPYFQAFCGEMHFQHRLPIDRSSMTRWRQRIGADDLEALLAETIAVAVKTKAVSQRQLERITVNTTVQTKAIAHPTDSHLILRAIEWPNRLDTVEKVGDRSVLTSIQSEPIASPAHAGAGTGTNLASLRRFWAVAASWNCSVAPLGPRSRIIRSPMYRFRWANSISTFRLCMNEVM